MEFFGIKKIWHKFYRIWKSLPWAPWKNRVKEERAEIKYKQQVKVINKQLLLQTFWSMKM